MQRLLLILFIVTTSLLAAQAPVEEMENTHQPNTPRLVNTRSFQLSQGWSIAEPFNKDGQPYVLFIMSSGTARDGNNVRIRPIKTDGSLGAAVKSYKWTEGWTSATFYYVGGKLHLMLVKEKGLSGSGHNVHCHRMNADGSVGPRVGAYRWSEGWTNFVYYYADRVSYMLQAKTKGLGGSGYNVRIRRINRDGSLGSVVKSYKWTEGWDTFEVFRQANKYHLLYAKSKGAGNSGYNVHLRPIKPDGTLDAITGSYRWSEGWTSLTPYYLGSKIYVHQAKKYPTGPNAASKIREATWNGTLTQQLNSMQISAGWSYFSSIRARGTTYLIGLRQRGYDPGGRTNLRLFEAQ